MSITRSEAVCIFFGKPQTKENIKKYTQKIQDMGEVELCYTENERNPALMPYFVIQREPELYKTYLMKPRYEQLYTEDQVKRFINQAYLCEKPPTNTMFSFETKSITTKEIFNHIQYHTSIFNEITSHKFAVWCADNHLLFLNNNQIRKNGCRARRLHIMSTNHHNDLVISITHYLPTYQELLKELLNNQYEIVGYIRKSPEGNTTRAERRRQLQIIIDNLRDRSFAERIYVSPCCQASVPFVERDFQYLDILENVNHVDGTTQDMLQYLAMVQHHICLVSIDFDGLSSCEDDLLNLVETHPSVKRIAIDTSNTNNQIILFDVDELKTDSVLQKKFVCKE